MINYNKDLDFIGFSTNIIREIDSLRSNGKHGSNAPVESRINAFYRAIGLPAVSFVPESMPAGNNGNLFAEITDNDIVFGVIDRENLFARSQSAGPSDAYVLDFNESTILDSINGSGKRASLFPMYVSADVGIFPQAKRVGVAFMTDQQLQDISSNDKTKYHRPLIETIIYLRLASLGNFNTLNNQKIISGTESNLLKSFLLVGDDIVSGIGSSLGNVIVEMSDIQQRIGQIRKQTSAQIIPEQNPEQNPDTQEDVAIQGQLDIQIANQQQYLALKQAQLLLFNFSDTVQNQNLAVKNLKEAALASTLLNAVLSDSGNIEKSTNDSEKRKAKTETDLKQVFRNLDLILGTFSGLSGTDVLAVLLALLLIDIESLIKLLNQDSLQRLKAQTNIDFVNFASDATNVRNAVVKLQTIVSNILNALHNQIIQYKHRNKTINQDNPAWWNNISGA